MFSYNRKKQLRNRVIAAATGVIVMTFGIWLNYTDNEDKKTEEAVQKIKIEEEEAIEETRGMESIEESPDLNVETNTDMADKTYLVKEENGAVKVYLCEGNNKELYLITSIPYDLLSENDQKMFKKGVVIDTDEDLGKFLENFDS